mmetsp:Transcript_13744/g.39822  ORF Transcript_13744/g.39822 Transcript_13744/m.39822 type:complete len:211 (-) Transcript_13744:296-928(-)
MAHARAAHMCVMRQEALQRRPQCTRQAERSPLHAAVVCKLQVSLCCSLFADAAVVGHNREAARRSSGHFYAAGAFQHPQLFELPEEAQMVTVKKAASAEAHAELSSLQCITNRQLHICFISAGAGCAAHAAGASVAAVMHAHSGILGTLRCAAEAAGRSTDGARPRDNISPARSGGHAVRGRGSHDRPCLRPGQYTRNRPCHRQLPAACS